MDSKNNKILNYFVSFILISFSIIKISKELPNSTIHLIVDQRSNIYVNELYYIEPFIIENGNNVTLIFNDEITSCENMFKGLSNIIEIDLSFFDFSKVKNMYSMFYGCTNLKKIKFGNINTSSVVNMSQLFFECKNLISIDLSNFDTSSVINMSRMFSTCEKILSIDASTFNTKNVKDMEDLFANCYKLLTINVSSFDTSNVKNMKGMFYRCYQIKYLDLRNFKADSLNRITLMFYSCKSLVYLNLISFIIKNSSNIIMEYNSVIFNNAPEYFKYCIKDNNTIDFMFQRNSEIKSSIDCSNDCFSDNIKIDMDNNKCIKACDEKFEYNNLCYNECPNNTFNIIYFGKKLCFEEDKIPENFYLDKNIYKECYKNCKKCSKEGDESNNNCEVCKDNLTFIKDFYINPNNCYEECNFNYYLDDSNNYFCTDNNTCPDNYKLIINKKKCIIDCKNDTDYQYEFNNTCYTSCPNGTTYISYKDKKCYDINSITIDDKANKIKEEYINGNTSKCIENEYNCMKYIDNMNVQLTSLDKMKNNTNNNISIIDLGECENILRDIYHINETFPLLIYKVEYYFKNLLIPIIGYEILHPIDKYELNLSYCNNTINFGIPVTIDENNLFLYEPDSDYYNDICFSYTSNNGTDITLKDRKTEFEDNNLSLCKKNCVYKGYDKTNKHSICFCEIEKFNFSDIKDDSNALSNQFALDENSISSSNILTVKCSKNLFSKNGLIKNISNYVISFIFVFYLISILLFIKCGYPMLKMDIEQIISKKRVTNKNIPKKFNKRSKTTKINTNFYPPKKVNINNIKIEKKFINNSKKLIRNSSLLNKKNNVKFINKNKNINVTLNIQNQKKKVQTKKGNNIVNTNNHKHCYSNNELDALSYLEAIKYDKRTCCQYYISLLRKNHPISFAFFPFKDYNSKIIKLYIFFLSFAIYYAVSFLFINENSIHKIYEDNGKYNILYFLPSICITFASSYTITVLIKLIFLSERNILKIKEEKNYNSAVNVSNIVKKNLIIKYIIFYIIGFIFLVAFWFFLSSFGAVYQNTQVILFINTLVSFGISLIFPFFISLITCCFRGCSLSDKKSKSECLYKTSSILQNL